ncbi:MAG: hypothetical protein ABIF92_00640, partial [archaeon]
MARKAKHRKSTTSKRHSSKKSKSYKKFFIDITKLDNFWGQHKRLISAILFLVIIFSLSTVVAKKGGIPATPTPEEPSPEEPAPEEPAGAIECSDKIDNDGDGDIDYKWNKGLQKNTGDQGCDNADDTDESNCGDVICEGDETCSNCEADCGTCIIFCGDGTCNGAEACSDCPADCGACPVEPSCGDGTCDADENCTLCEADCGACPAFCGDGACDADENCSTCINDCGACPLPGSSCGDDTCDA